MKSYHIWPYEAREYIKLSRLFIFKINIIIKHMKILRDFISNEERDFKVKVGSTIASSLTGFIAGIIVASIIWWIFEFLR